MATPRQWRRRRRFSLFALTVVGALVVAAVAFGAVTTSQSDYSPGSEVKISGDNSNGAGYVPGNPVEVAVSGGGGWSDSCSATVADDGNGTWSCTVTLSDDPSIAVGSYTYTATSTAEDGSTISETGTFTDVNVNKYYISGATLSFFGNGSTCSSGSSPFATGTDVCTDAEYTVDVTSGNGDAELYLWWIDPSSTRQFIDSVTGLNTTGTFHLKGHHVINTQGEWTVKACISNTACTGANYITSSTFTISSAAPPTKLAFTTSALTGTVGQCLGPITVQTQNASNVATNVAADTTVNLASDSGTTGAGAFYSDSACGTSITSRTITAGTNSTPNFYYEATHRGSGSHVVTASATGLTQAQQTETINKADQTISVTTHAPSTATYGDQFTVAATGGASGNSIVYGSSGACSNSGATFTMTSGTGTCTVTYDQAGNDDYNAATQVTESVTAEKKLLTVTADDQTAQYSDKTPTLLTSFTYSDDFVGTDTPDDINTPPTCVTDRLVSDPAGTVRQTGCGGGSDDNYSFTYVRGTFTVTKEDAQFVNVDINSGGAVPVSQNSFHVTADVKEIGPTEPNPSNSALWMAGEISKVTSITAKITGLATNSTYTGSCSAGTAPSGTAYTNLMPFDCTFSGGPFEVDAYTLSLDIPSSNLYYKAETYEEGFVVWDPAAGFATGGGTFRLDGDRVSFGFSYTQSKNKLRSGFVAVRHFADGSSCRIKSTNQMGPAAVKDNTVTLTGTGNYVCLDANGQTIASAGNISISAYAQDNGTPGAGTDKFWVRNGANFDPNYLKMDASPVTHAVLLTGGNVQVPQPKKK